MSDYELSLEEIIVNHLDPLMKVIRYGLDDDIDPDEALEISHAMVNTLSRELWRYEKRRVCG